MTGLGHCVGCTRPLRWGKGSVTGLATCDTAGCPGRLGSAADWSHDEASCGDGHEERRPRWWSRWRRMVATIRGAGGCAAVLGSGRGSVRCTRERGHAHDGAPHRARSRVDPRARICWDDRGHTWLERR